MSYLSLFSDVSRLLSLHISLDLFLYFIVNLIYIGVHIDDFLNIVWLCLLKSKGKCFERFKEFKALAESQSKHKTKAIMLDNKWVYISKALERFLKDHIIQNQRPQRIGLHKMEWQSVQIAQS